MRVCVTGSRNWCDADLLRLVLTRFRPVRIGVGDCPTGADPLALAWAEDNAYAWQQYKADWDTRGKAAGPFRNREMLKLETPRATRRVQARRRQQGHRRLHPRGPQLRHPCPADSGGLGVTVKGICALIGLLIILYAFTSSGLVAGPDHEAAVAALRLLRGDT